MFNIIYVTLYNYSILQARKTKDKEKIDIAKQIFTPTCDELSEKFPRYGNSFAYAL